MPKTKVVCTIGPSSSSPEMIEKLIGEGMNVARLNFSHGTHQEHFDKINIIRRCSEQLNKPVAILLDLCGPKIRVGNIQESGAHLKSGQTFILTSKQVEGDEKRVSVSYTNLPQEVKENDRILLADGMMELVVQKTTQDEIHCEVIIGGILTSHKGINLPSGTIKAETITNKDKEDLSFGLRHDVDYVALSFVRNASDIIKLRGMIRKENKNTPIIAKMEKHEAIDNADEIMEAADGVMVARGDLGVEVSMENVPIIQKMLVNKANKLGKPVIIATQMLRSMVDSPRPTRAEATDVANAVFDGADAVMLSEETASGKYPIESLQFMVRIIKSAEKSFSNNKYLRLVPKKETSESVAHASCILAEHLDAVAIVATTQSGHTAMHISHFRPKPMIIASSPNKSTVRQLALFWGCVPILVESAKDTDEMIDKAASLALEMENVSKGDLIVITAGHPVWVAGATNMLRVKRL